MFIHLNLHRFPINQIGILLVLILLNLPGYSQQDFNRFQTLVAKGTIPADFTTYTSDKIQSDLGTKRTDLSPAKEKIFLQGIHQKIDQLLHSGSVIYGDEISLYVQTVAANLLKDEPELLAKLRFYTIKSNETNALSTDQGIVFVTTGLISQLTSEAQLAYVLSHEIAHYTEKHVVETFDWKTKNQYQYNRIEKLSAYSKEHELEADKIALKRYHDAGYSDKEIVPTFDVLMYSYLPFDEIDFPKSYFNSNLMYVPANNFPTKNYPIKAEEDYDDSKSSHPNIRKRKDAVIDALGSYGNWGDVVYSQGMTQFVYVRNLARFESLRTDIIDGNFGEALYSIFILEQEFTNCEYLKQMKALAWLGLAQFKQDGRISETVPSSTNYEGESADLFFMIKKINGKALLTLGLRIVYDIHKELPQNEFVNGVYDRYIQTIAASEDFSIEAYSSKNFHESAELALQKRAQADTAKTIPTDDKKSKYDRIKTKKNVNAPEGFDSTEFYLYGLSDVISDSVFLSKFKAYHKIEQEKKDQEEAYKKLSRKEKYELERENRKKGTEDYGIGLAGYILVQPSLSDFSQSSEDTKSNEKKEKELCALITDVSKELGIEATVVNQESIVLNGTAGFNERSALFSFLEQKANFKDIDMFPVDYESLKNIQSTYTTQNVMFTSIEHYYDANISWMFVSTSFFIFPTFPFTLLGYIPVQLLSGHNTEVNSIVLDIKTGKLIAYESKTVQSKPKKYILGSYYYNLLTQLKKAPKL